MRLFVLLLSMASVVFYGYALAGYGGAIFGRGRPDYVLWGLTAGTICGVLALLLWRKWMPHFIEEIEENPESAEDRELEETAPKKKADGDGLGPSDF